MHDQPLINPNWLTSETDQQVAIASIKRLRQIFDTDAMKHVEIGPEYYPGRKNVSSDAEILSDVRNTLATINHAASSCRMGKPSDPDAVVDPQGRVIGVVNLRVVDASTFPFLPPGLPHGTVYALAEKIADDIKRGHGGY